MTTPKIGLILIASLFLSSCISSVSTRLVKKEGLGNGNEAKGKAILNEAWLAQGLDKLGNHKTYEMELTDTWKGVLGKLNKPWPEAKMDLNLKFGIKTFDGQVSYNSGSKANQTEGIQSWEYYKLNESGKAIFPEKEKNKINFILPAIQYFTELTDRLKTAELITYAGKKEFNGQSYDLVFTTWNKLKSHKQNDQYLLWVNSETKLVDYCEFTIHETFSARYFTGSICYKDYTEIDGVKIPFSQYLFAGSPKIDNSKNLHSIKIESFEFDSFNESLLYPNPNLKKMGDAK